MRNEKKKISTLKELESISAKDIADMLKDNDTAWWDYVTALRGQDNTIYPLKTVFTGFIRGNTRRGISIIHWRSFFNTHSAKQIANSMSYINIQEHWKTHILSAIFVLTQEVFSRNSQVALISNYLHDLLYTLLDRDMRESIKIIKNIKTAINEDTINEISNDKDIYDILLDEKK